MTATNAEVAPRIAAELTRLRRERAALRRARAAAADTDADTDAIDVALGDEA